MAYLLTKRGCLVGLTYAYACLAVATAQPSNALPVDPRHHFDKRCPKHIKFDPPSTQRDWNSTSSYMATPLASDATAEDCAALCCHDWSCEAFAFVGAKANTKQPLAPTSASNCTAGEACCIFKDDIDALVPGNSLYWPVLSSSVVKLGTP